MKSIMTDNDTCFVCGRTATEIHHVMNGWGMRKLSDEDGLTVPLCAFCHRAIHADAGARLLLKEEAQKAYEKTHSREDWMRRYGKNYL